MKRIHKHYEHHEIIKEYIINKHLSVGMDKKKNIGVLVDGKWIRQCHHALLQITDGNDEGLITMDEAIEKLSKKEHQKRMRINSNTEFIAHASNIQAWAELDYDPRFLDSRIAVGILHELSRVDKNAKRKLEGEMMERFLQFPDTHKLWFFENYHQYLADDTLFPAITRILNDMLVKDEEFKSKKLVGKFLEECIANKISIPKIIAFMIENMSWIFIDTNSTLLKHLHKSELIMLAKKISINNVHYWRVKNTMFACFMLELVKLRKDQVIAEGLDKADREIEFEKACFIIAQKDPDYRVLFGDDDWVFLNQEYEKMDKNWIWFMKFININNRSYRKFIQIQEESEKLYGNDGILSCDIREREINTIVSPPTDYPALVWALRDSYDNFNDNDGIWKDMDWFPIFPVSSRKMKRKPLSETKFRIPFGATHVIHDFVDEGLVTQKNISVYRVVNEHGDVSWIKKEKIGHMARYSTRRNIWKR